MVGQRPKGYCAHCCNIRPLKDIRIHFYNKAKPDWGAQILLEPREGALRDAGADNSSKTVMFIHGFSETFPGKSTSTIKYG